MSKIKKFKPADLRPVVRIFDKEYKLPYFTTSIGDGFTAEQTLMDIRKVIEDTYPGIQRPEANMVYLHLLRESKKDIKGNHVIPVERDVVIDGKPYHLDFSMIQRRLQSTHEIDGARYVFRVPTAYEVSTAGLEANHTSILNYLFQYVEFEGEKYKLDDIDGGLPCHLNYRVQDIIGDIFIELPGGGFITGVEKIEKLFVTGVL